MLEQIAMTEKYKGWLNEVKINDELIFSLVLNNILM